MATFHCSTCGIPFERYPSATKRRKSDKVYCSRKCAAQRQQTALPDLTCTQCGKTFYRKPSERKLANNYCSRTCANQAQSRTLKDVPHLRDSQGVEKCCIQCSNVFYVKPHRYKKAKFCSKACFYAHNYGRRGHGNGMSNAGNNNPNFKGTNNRVTARDNAIAFFGRACMICGWDVVISVHHIIPRRSGGTNNLDNLIVLCPNHHAMADRGLLEPSHLATVVHDVIAQLSDRPPRFDLP